jgi:transposase
MHPRRKAQEQETVAQRIQKSAKTLPQYPDPGPKKLPPIPARQNGKRGRIAKSDAHNLWERLKQHETAVLLFAKQSHVSFTNKRAGRDLRMSKLKQKVSGCFRTKTFAEAYCRISSYLQTMANNQYNPLVAIQLALSGQLYIEQGE